MNKLPFLAVIFSFSIALLLQACSKEPAPVESRVIPAPAPKEIVKIAPAPPPRVLLGDKKTIIDDLLSRKLGMPTEHNTTYEKANKLWSLDCGKALSPDGGAIDFKKSKMAKQAADGFFDNNYCALFQKQDGQYKMVEFDYGSTDSQIFKWMVRHKIPAKMLK